MAQDADHVRLLCANGDRRRVDFRLNSVGARLGCSILCRSATDWMCRHSSGDVSVHGQILPHQFRGEGRAMKASKSVSCAVVGAISLMTLATMASASESDKEKAITVFKTPWCGCCQIWVEAMQKAGYRVVTHDLEDLSKIKQQAEVPQKLEACHTSVIGETRNYALEGHVPIAAVEKLQSEKPNIRGISTPGMPQGSLGMGYDENAKYTVYAFTGRSDETPSPFYQAGSSE